MYWSLLPPVFLLFVLLFIMIGLPILDPVKDQTMTPDDKYSLGYVDGKDGKAMSAPYMTDPDYTMGFEDGKGDRKANRPVEEEYAGLNDPPDGFEFTGEKRVPNPYEYYLSKGGNATFLKHERKNKQTRHILNCSECFNSEVGRGVFSRGACFCHPEVKGG